MEESMKLLKRKLIVVGAIAGLAVAAALAANSAQIIAQEDDEEVVAAANDNSYEARLAQSRAVTKLLIRNDDESLPDAANDVSAVFGKPNSEITGTNSANRCGYGDTDFQGALKGALLMHLSTNNTKGARIPRNAFWKYNDNPDPGRKLLTFARIDGGTNCTETITVSGTTETWTFARFSATY